MSLYKLLCTSVPILLGRRCDSFLHRGIEKTANTFEGKLSCGACCYMLHFHLKQMNIESKMMLKQIGREDHCYLLYNGVVFDPTYRQFIDSNKWFESFLYIGSVKEIERHCVRPFWSEAKESPEIMDAHLVIENEQYANNKGVFFGELHHIITN